MYSSSLSIRQLTLEQFKQNKNRIMDLQERIYENLPLKEYYITTDLEEILSFMEQGGIMFGAFHDKDPVAISWAGKNDSHLQEVRKKGVNIPGHNVMVHDSVFVDSRFRGRGLQSVFMEMTLKEAKKQGYDSAWCQAHPKNTASLMSIQKAGYTKLGMITAFHGWPRIIFHRSP